MMRWIGERPVDRLAMRTSAEAATRVDLFMVSS